MAAYEAAREAICIRRVLMELGKYKHKRPITLNEDNQACIKLAENPCAAERTKSMDVKYHFLRERVADGEINMRYCETNEQLADLLTKALPLEKVVYLRRGIMGR